jgi:hypothetical protein
VEATLPTDPTAAVQAAGTLAPELTRDVLCELLGRRDRPAVPQLTLHVSPQEAPPGGRVRVRAKLTDGSDGRVQPGKDVRLEQRHGAAVVTSLPYPTDLSGEVVRELDVGDQPGRGSVEASFTGRRGRVTRSNPVSVPYRVWEPAGDIVIRSPQAALTVGGAETVTATLLRSGTPVQGAPIAFAASGGTVGSPSATTDAGGNAETPYQAPGSNSIVDVTATTTAPAKGPRAGGELTATLTFVVDGGVTLSLNAAQTVGGTASTVTADLVVGGRALPATSVNFALTGAGTLSAPAAATNDAGRAEVLWLPPSGDSSATITAAAVVDGQRYTQSVDVGAGASGGSVAARVLPGTWDNEVLTGVGVSVDPSPYCFSTLVTTNACRGSNLADYAGPPAELPVTLRADAGGYFVSLALTHPRPAAVVAEMTGSLGGTNDSFTALGVLEFTFDGPGSLEIAVDDPVPTPSGRWAVRRPAAGATTFVGAIATDPVLAHPVRTGNVTVPGAGTLELQLHMGAYTRDDPAFSGTRRMTFTFRPQ